MAKGNFILAGILALVFLGSGFLTGWKLYPIVKPCSVITHDTILVYDTITYTIHDSIPYVVRDTIFYPKPYEVPSIVDTAAILRDYYAVYDYTWSRPDTNLLFNFKTRVTQNKPIGYDFTYKILRPQQVINNITDNSITYNRYISLGLDIPIKNVNQIEIEGLYNWDKGYLGVGYTPELKSASIKLGATILKFKKRR